MGSDQHSAGGSAGKPSDHTSSTLPRLWAELQAAQAQLDATHHDIDDPEFAVLASAVNDRVAEIIGREPVMLGDAVIQIRAILMNEDWYEDRIAPTLERIASQMLDLRAPVLPTGVEEAIADIEKVSALLQMVTLKDPAEAWGRVVYLSDRLEEHVAELTGFARNQPPPGSAGPFSARY